MSSDNFLSVEPNKNKWEVWVRSASTGAGYPDGGQFNTRDEAINHAIDVQTTEVIEYGMRISAPPIKAMDKTIE